MPLKRDTHRTLARGSRQAGKAERIDHPFGEITPWSNVSNELLEVSENEHCQAR